MPKRNLCSKKHFAFFGRDKKKPGDKKRKRKVNFYFRKIKRSTKLCGIYAAKMIFSLSIFVQKKRELKEKWWSQTIFWLVSRLWKELAACWAVVADVSHHIALIIIIIILYCRRRFERAKKINVETLSNIHFLNRPRYFRSHLRKYAAWKQKKCSEAFNYMIHDLIRNAKG